jgi:hypothetical protein
MIGPISGRLDAARLWRELRAMAFSRGFWMVRLALLVGGLAGCAAEPRQPVSPAQRFTLLEHVQVVGACVLESGGVSARYAGFVERWRDVRKGRDLLHGSVSTVDRFADPGRTGHRPPLSIQFGETDVAPLSAGQLVLTGTSEGSQPSRAATGEPARARAGLVPPAQRAEWCRAPHRTGGGRPADPSPGAPDERLVAPGAGSPAPAGLAAARVAPRPECYRTPARSSPSKARTWSTTSSGDCRSP